MILTSNCVVEISPNAIARILIKMRICLPDIGKGALQRQFRLLHRPPSESQSRGAVLALCGLRRRVMNGNTLGTINGGLMGFLKLDWINNKVFDSSNICSVSWVLAQIFRVGRRGNPRIKNFLYASSNIDPSFVKTPLRADEICHSSPIQRGNPRIKNFLYASSNIDPSFVKTPLRADEICHSSPIQLYR
jgi:hypothetical protein